MELLLLAPLLLLGLLPLFGSGADDDPDPEPQPRDPLVLTDDDDLRYGTAQDDIIFARDGDDTIDSGNGDDRVYGEAGDDTLAGKDGADALFGGDGDDVAQGDAGNDRVFLGDGDDRISTRAPHSHSDGDDLLRGGAGDDVITDWVGANTLHGDLDHDRLDARDAFPDGTAPFGTPRADALAPDTVFGGFGADTLRGDHGDLLSGGAGRDLFGVEVWLQDGAAARITDLADDEVLVITEAQTDAAAALTTRLAASGTDLEVLLGDRVVAVLEGRTAIADWQLRRDIDTDGTDPRTLGTDGDNWLAVQGNGYGLEGDDVLTGGYTDDQLFGGDGDDRLAAQDGNDGLRGGDGDDTLNGGAGRDTLFGEQGADVLDGREGGGEESDSLLGGAGDDLLIGDGADWLDGGAGHDTFVRDMVNGLQDDSAGITVNDFDPASDMLRVVVPAGVPVGALDIAAGPDGAVIRLDGQPVMTLLGIDPADVDPAAIVIQQDGDSFRPGFGDDTWIGSAGDDSVFGRAGDDSLAGLGGDDSLSGNAGNDTIDAGDGDDRVAAGSGDDTVTGNSGNDQVQLNDGDDTFRDLPYRPWGEPSPPSGDDMVRGGDGNDDINGGLGTDTLFGELGDDVVSAIDGRTSAEAAPDHLFGGFGRDLISGDDGDTISGGAGRDQFVVYDYLSGDAPVVITDLEPGENIFIVGGFNLGPEDNDQPEYRIAANGRDTEIIGNGVAVIVQGRTDYQNFSVTLGHA